ncbi:hypothetical protein DYB31_013550, partial [Aphanomyces astaci]
MGGNVGGYSPRVISQTLARPINSWRLIRPMLLMQSNVGSGFRHNDDVFSSPLHVQDVVGGVRPPRREKHTASALGKSKMLVFGGRQLAGPSFNDVWQLDVGTPTTLVSDQSMANVLLRDGADTWTTAVASTDPTATCIQSMQVVLNITHSCLNTLEVFLYGPGPSTLPALQQDDKTGSDVARDVTQRLDGVCIGATVTCNAWQTLQPLGESIFHRRYGQLFFVTPFQVLVPTAGLQTTDDQSSHDQTGLDLLHYSLTEPTSAMTSVYVANNDTAVPSHRYFTAGAWWPASTNSKV